jgi:hypothetical protein
VRARHGVRTVKQSSAPEYALARIMNSWFAGISPFIAAKPSSV